MSKNNLTILAALTELKFLSKTNGRREKALQKIDSVCVISKNSKQNPKVTNAKSDIQSYLDLVEREVKLRRAITESNANTKVEIPTTTPGKTEIMSVAEVISTKKYKIPHYKQLRNLLSDQYCVASHEVEKRNNAARDRAEKEISRDNKDKDSTQINLDEIREREEYIMKFHGAELCDPVNVEGRIKELDEWIRIYEEEVDSILSASNAVTLITV